MWLTALSFIKSNWKGILIAAVIAAAYFYVHNLQTTNEKLRGQVTSLTADNTTLKGNVDVLKSAITASHDALSKVDAAAKQTQAGFAALDSTVRTQSLNLAAKLAKQQQAPKPVTCEDTIKYLIDMGQGYKQ